MGSSWRRKDLGTIQSINVLAYRSSIEDGGWQKCCGHLRTDSSLIVQNWKCSRKGFRAEAKNLFFIFFKDRGHSEIVRLRWGNYFYYFISRKGNLQKNISPPLGVIRQAIYLSTNISPLPGVPNLYKHPSFRRKHFSLRLISSGGKMDRMP